MDSKFSKPHSLINDLSTSLSRTIRALSKKASRGHSFGQEVFIVRVLNFVGHEEQQSRLKNVHVILFCLKLFHFQEMSIVLGLNVVLFD